MVGKNEGTAQKELRPQNLNKGSELFASSQKIRKLFLTGRHFCLVQLNAWTGCNNARECISLLRKQGMDIKEMRFTSHEKVYWLAKSGGESRCLSTDGRMPARTENVWQNAPQEPQRLDSVLYGEWIPMFAKRANRSLARKEACNEK